MQAIGAAHAVLPCSMPKSFSFAACPTQTISAQSRQVSSQVYTLKSATNRVVPSDESIPPRVQTPQGTWRHQRDGDPSSRAGILLRARARASGGPRFAGNRRHVVLASEGLVVSLEAS